MAILQESQQTLCTFAPFAGLPHELRYQIWDECLPSPDDTPALTNLIRGLTHHILDLHSHKSIQRIRLHPPRIDPALYREILKQLRTYGPSPYEVLDACEESRVVALKHVKRLLKEQKLINRWLRYPPLGFWLPKLEVVRQKGKGRLVYSCGGLEGEWMLEELIFWDVEKERMIFGKNDGYRTGKTQAPFTDDAILAALSADQIEAEYNEEDQNNHLNLESSFKRGTISDITLQQGGMEGKGFARWDIGPTDNDNTEYKSTNPCCYSQAGKKRKREDKDEDEAKSLRQRIMIQ